LLRKQYWNFVINGAAGVGKDLFINAVSKILKAHSDIIVNNLSTVTHIKEIAKVCFGWNGEKDEKGRRLLSDLKDADVRYRNGPFETVCSEIEDCVDLNPDKYIVNFIQTREPKEIHNFQRTLENCQTILVRRNTGISYLNHADKNVENYIYDFIIHNNKSITELEEKAYLFVETILLK